MRTKLAALVVAAATAALLLGGWSWHGNSGHAGTKLAGWAWDTSSVDGSTSDGHTDGWAWDDTVDPTSIG